MEVRARSARLHSAGHLIDVAMSNIGYDFIPTKGHHFPDVAYVEYTGDIPNDKRDAAVGQLQAALDALLAEGRTMGSESVAYEEIGAKCGGATPSYMPVGKPARIVTIAGEPGCPCGGTHVGNIKDIGRCVVTKIVKKKKNVRVCYEVLQ